MSETIEEILISVYHDGSMSQGGKTIHSGTVAEALQAIEDIMNERVIGGDWDYYEAIDPIKIKTENDLRVEQRANLSKALRGKE